MMYMFGEQMIDALNVNYYFLLKRNYSRHKDDVL